MPINVGSGAFDEDESGIHPGIDFADSCQSQMKTPSPGR